MQQVKPRSSSANVFGEQVRRLSVRHMMKLQYRVWPLHQTLFTAQLCSSKGFDVHNRTKTFVSTSKMNFFFWLKQLNTGFVVSISQHES